MKSWFSLHNKICIILNQKIFPVCTRGHKKIKWKDKDYGWKLPERGQNINLEPIQTTGTNIKNTPLEDKEGKKSKLTSKVLGEFESINGTCQPVEVAEGMATPKIRRNDALN